MKDENENLISIKDLITKAKRFGVDFGNGDPKNRLRYYVKVGLLPHAQRKSFNGLPPDGAYPKNVLGVLLEIDKKLKAGKSIREIKDEREKKIFEKKSSKFNIPEYIYPNDIGLDIESYYPKVETPRIIEKEKKELEVKENYEVVKKISFVKIPVILKIVFLFLICIPIVFFVNRKINFIDSISYSLANINSGIKKLAQVPLFSSQEKKGEVFDLPAIEPYLTINAETDINAPLRVRGGITAPSFSLVKDNFEGKIVVANLTAEREYNFPDKSGTVCLSTGNCIDLVGEANTFDGTSNRLTKFISNQKIGDSSINDLYLEGIAVSINSDGNVGIGTESPDYPLSVQGKIQATGDICTDLGGGRCLSTLETGQTVFLGGGGSGGTVTSIDISVPTGMTMSGGPITSSGTLALDYDTGYSAILDASTTEWNSKWNTLSDMSLDQGYFYVGDSSNHPIATSSIFIDTSGNIGIGTTTPSQKLDVAGTIKINGFQLPTDATSGYILTSDDTGFGTWQSAPSGSIPSGIAGQTLRHNNTSWLADSFFYNTGSAIGIGTTSTLATLTVSGDGLFQGPLVVSTSTLAQLVLEYDDDNDLKFSINKNQSEISSSKIMVVNSLTGEIQLGDDVIVFNAAGAEVQGKTFISTTSDSTVRKSGEMVFRSSIPIFRYSISAQTDSTAYERISKYFSLSDSLDSLVPSQLPGTTRKYAFLINFADDIATTSNSIWRVSRPDAGTEYSSSTFSGQNLSSLDEGNSHLTNFIELPNNDWQLDVEIPSGTIRIFNVLLLTFDQII